MKYVRLVGALMCVFFRWLRPASRDGTGEG